MNPKPSLLYRFLFESLFFHTHRAVLTAWDSLGPRWHFYASTMDLVLVLCHLIFEARFCFCTG